MATGKHLLKCDGIQKKYQVMKRLMNRLWKMLGICRVSAMEASTGDRLDQKRQEQTQKHNLLNSSSPRF